MKRREYGQGGALSAQIAQQRKRIVAKSFAVSLDSQFKRIEINISTRKRKETGRRASTGSGYNFDSLTHRH